MYLYGKVTIDDQAIKFAAFVTGVSIGVNEGICYTLAPTTVFTRFNKIDFLSLDCNKNNTNGWVWFKKQSESRSTNAKCDFSTDSLVLINLLKME